MCTTYCGVMTFLDCQKYFDTTFDLSPGLLNAQPDKNNPASFLKRVHTYADCCILDVFITIYRDNYAGPEDIRSERKQVHEIYKIITKLRQGGEGKLSTHHINYMQNSQYCCWSPR